MQQLSQFLHWTDGPNSHGALQGALTPIDRTTNYKSIFAQRLVNNNHTIGDLNNGLEILFNNKQDLILNEKLNFKSHFIFNAIISHCKRVTLSSCLGVRGRRIDVMWPLSLCFLSQFLTYCYVLPLINVIFCFCLFYYFKLCHINIVIS